MNGSGGLDRVEDNGAGEKSDDRAETVGATREYSHSKEASQPAAEEADDL